MLFSYTFMGLHLKNVIKKNNILEKISHGASLQHVKIGNMVIFRLGW
jgi:hypothetical protein